MGYLGSYETVEESIFPHLEEIRRKIPEWTKEAFDIIIKQHDPKTIKPWAAMIVSSFTSKKVDEVYAGGMDDALNEMEGTELPMETVKELFEHMGLPGMTVESLLYWIEKDEESLSEDQEEAKDSCVYLSGNLSALEEEMNMAEDDDPDCMLLKSLKPRNINFARNTLRYMAEGAKDEVFFASMGINHLLGEYGYLNLMSALLGKPLLRFDDRTGEFVPGETYLDSFTAGRPALLEGLRAQGILPQV